MQIFRYEYAPFHFCETAADSTTTKRIISRIQHGQSPVTSNPLITRLTIAETQLQITENIQILNKFLFRQTPCHSSRKEVRPFIVFREFAGTVNTIRCRKDVFIHQRIIDTPQKMKPMTNPYGRSSICQEVYLGSYHIPEVKSLRESRSRHRFTSIVPLLDSKTAHGINGVDFLECLIGSKQ